MLEEVAKKLIVDAATIVESPQISVALEISRIKFVIFSFYCKDYLVSFPSLSCSFKKLTYAIVSFE
jgi:hypothetical protein